jgi:hypothetical protein
MGWFSPTAFFGAPFSGRAMLIEIMRSDCGKIKENETKISLSSLPRYNTDNI